MKKTLLASAAIIALGGAGVAHAGNIVLTGHDNDLHQEFGANPGPSGPAGLALTAEAKFVVNGSTLPILTFDQGGELVSSLTADGFTVHNVSTAAGITAALFDPTLYSAMAVASVTSCGGCDNSPAFIAAITAQKAAINTFFNDGRGILGLASASDPSGYAYVPAAANNPGGSPPSTGYVQTAAGAALGLPAVDGNPTHNFFSEPGTGGLSSVYVVTERLGSATTGTPETVAVKAGTSTCIVNGTCVTKAPEPGTMGLFGVGLVGLAAAWRRKRGSKV